MPVIINAGIGELTSGTKVHTIAIWTYGFDHIIKYQ